jgi:uncharacterized membrane protein YkoI
MREWRDLYAFAGIAAVAVASSCWAQPLDEHDAARAAVNARASLPLEAIIERAGLSPDQILDARIVRTEPSYRYRLKILDDDNRVREVLVDGLTGAIVTGE